MHVGRKLFRTTPEETAQILSTPGFDAMSGTERCGVIMDVVKTFSSLEEDSADATTSKTNARKNTTQKSFRTKKEGSFLEIALTPCHYTYGRKLRGLTGYAFYDILTTQPLRRKDLTGFSQCSILLNAALVFTPVWPAIGWLPLSEDRSWISYSWTAHSTFNQDEWDKGIRNTEETEFFLVTH
ncbi:hypothetical protein GCM10011495_36370 [Hymenobacter frigidus]|uniref:Uncharacterized protein n=2 Tax=Hymenobacter frigidus TaxID=1524095 RepID=A0ABQ2AGS7_9BACT|nr:hypothetical protein GCM10011495_36370 [Hymenobacter frigidus]